MLGNLALVTSLLVVIAMGKSLTEPVRMSLSELLVTSHSERETAVPTETAEIVRTDLEISDDTMEGYNMRKFEKTSENSDTNAEIEDLSQFSEDQYFTFSPTKSHEETHSKFNKDSIASMESENTGDVMNTFHAEIQSEEDVNTTDTLIYESASDKLHRDLIDTQNETSVSPDKSGNFTPTNDIDTNKLTATVVVNVDEGSDSSLDNVTFAGDYKDTDTLRNVSDYAVYEYDLEMDDNTTSDFDTSMAGVGDTGRDSTDLVYDGNGTRTDQLNSSVDNVVNDHSMPHDKYQSSSNSSETLSSFTGSESYDYSSVNSTEYTYSGTGYYDVEIDDPDNPVSTSEDRGAEIYDDEEHFTINSSGYDSSGSGIGSTDLEVSSERNLRQGETLYDDEDYTSSGYSADDGISGSGMDTSDYVSGFTKSYHIQNDRPSDDEDYTSSGFEDSSLSGSGTLYSGSGYYDRTNDDATSSGSGAGLESYTDDEDFDTSNTAYVEAKKHTSSKKVQMTGQILRYRHKGRFNVTSDTFFRRSDKEILRAHNDGVLNKTAYESTNLTLYEE